MLHHKRLVDVESARSSSRNSRSTPPRQSRQQQARLVRSDEEEEEADDVANIDDLEDQWRQAAQMLTDDDELLIAGASDNRGNDTARSRHHNHHHHHQQQQQQQFRGRSTPTSTPTSTATSSTQNQRCARLVEGEEPPGYSDDDNSSISFAQSGCHSILSAWRIKSANRRAARQAAANRPVSVLSNASSNGKKSTVASTAFTSRGKSPASQTRIPLGPKQAQHFVTNTRRRRRANELILNTLEARRRALALNRQNASSIYGSNPYLAFEGGVGGPDGASLSIQQHQQPGYGIGAADYGAACVSLSPSPVGRKTPSPAPRQTRTALSDLGTAKNAPNATAAGQAQRQRLLRSVNQQQQQYQKSPSPSHQQQLNLKTQAGKKASTKSVGSRQPPLAKLDQNSSDLYSSNSSSSSSSSLSDSSSSGSRFTQLVTSELVAPSECLLLGDERTTRRTTTASRSMYQQPPAQARALERPRPAERTTRLQQASSSSYTTARSPTPRSGSSPTATAASERHRREQLEAEQRELEQRELEQASSRQKQQQQQQQQEASNADERSARMRRGALGRDSIRRLRLTRASSSGQAGQTTNGFSSSGESAAPSSGVSSSESSANQQQQQAATGSVRQLSAQRKQDIESNPFLNRGHFRSTSTRSITSRAGSVVAPNYEEQHQQPLSTAKRSSWLFGGNRKQAAAATTNSNSDGSSPAARNNTGSDSSKPSAARFSLAETRRRSNSSENIERERTSNKVSKQQEEQEQQQEESIRQVERMLRQMRPNQVFTSYAKENKTVKSQSGSIRAPQSGASGDGKSYDATTTSRQQTTITNLGSLRPTSPPPPPPPRAKPAQRTPAKQRSLANTSTSPERRQQVPTTSAGRSVSATRLRPMSPSATSSSGWVAREGIKSHDDLKFDADGNKQRFALEDRWRHKKSPENQQQVSERLTSERLETRRSTSISPPPEFANSSARAWRPLQTAAGATTTAATQMLAGQPLTPADRVAALQRAAAQREAQIEAAQYQQQQRQVAHRLADQQQERRRQQATVVDSSPTKRLLEPAVTSQVFLRSSKQSVAAPSSAIGVSPTTQTEALPMFERTAGDEFRKRVDYLRKLARSNLTEPATRGNQQQASSSQRATQSHLLLATERPAEQQQQKLTTKPLSTNWRPQGKPATAGRPDSPSSSASKQLSVETRDQRPISQFLQPQQQHQQKPPISPKPRLTTVTTTTTCGKTGLAGNPSIEAALLADRYQTRDQLCSGGVPGAAFKWRRSNSSLASLGSNSNTAGSRLSSGTAVPRPQSQLTTTSGNIRNVPPRPLSPLASSELGVRGLRPNETQRVAYANLALGGYPAATAPTTTTNARPPSRSSSVLSQPPSRELTSQAVVKLVVKEKSAPKLDYAFVEGREETSSNNDNSAGARLIANKQQEAPLTPAPPLQQLPSKTQVVSRLAQQQQQVATRARSPVRVASPRSPEFGAMAASSNDDSAIASSVSSPSLSFMLNPAEQQKAAAAAANAAAARSASPVGGGARNSSTNRTTTTTSPSSSQRGQQATGGNLQSILRRQQQQQLQCNRQSAESSSDSSQQVPSREQQQRVGSPIESSALKRSLGLTSSEFVQQNPANFQQRQQQQQMSSSESTSDFRSSSFSPAASLLPPGDESAAQQLQQQQLAASATSSPPKRVHFNDRTSIRSFESISSLASNSTAVPNDALRQQVGSPDSMGSGSTSRLSADSPDLRKSSGAAIYAIRGDPELELELGEQHQQQLLASNNPAASDFHRQQQQQLMAASSHLTSPQQQQQQFRQQPQHLRYQMPEFESQMQRQQQQQQQQLIRMTAPPTISTSTGGQQQQPAIQYIARPTSLTSTQIVPTKVTLAGPNQHLYHQHQQLQEDDEDDPNYVLRLRQAATRGRVFNYSALPGQLPPQVAPPAIPAHHNQHQQHPVVSGMQHSPMGQMPLPPPPPAAAAVQAHLHQHQHHQRQHQRRPLEGLLNFQTEV